MATEKLVNAVTGETSTQTYTQPTPTAEENLQALREVRNRFLAETDVWALSDRTMTQAQTDYRQALRDITDSYTSLDDVVWPTKP